ncbi:MAG: hypothetical protein IBJ03_03420 [Gemmatimonadaceae bacterium]|nr:hypothetical protein [Gemmatimonadaceae bacterium]
MPRLSRRARMLSVMMPCALTLLIAPARTLLSQPPGSPGAARPNPPQGPPVPTTFEGLFAERDLRARGALQYMQCLQETTQAARNGALGDMSPSWSIACVPQGNEWRGAVVELITKDPGVRVHRQWALRGSGMAVRDRVDTTLVSSVAYAMERGMSVVRPGRGVADFMPIALVHSGYSEVWFLPALGNSARPVVGGDSVIQMKQDGTGELGHAKNTPPIRTLTAPTANVPWTIVSSEERVPLISELIAARRGVAVAGEVRLRTKDYDSVLRRNGAWTHTLRAGAKP